MLTILWHINIIPGEFFRMLILINDLINQVLIQFLNFAFFIAAFVSLFRRTDIMSRFIQFATYNTGDIGCDSLTGDLHNAFCSLPKACEGINCVVWFVSPPVQTDSLGSLLLLASASVIGR
jgi:hypothetical protein